MDAKQLEELDKELGDAARYILITPNGWDLSGWSKPEAVLILDDFLEFLTEDAKDELIEGRE